MQFSNETYNGWSNRETWLVNLWLTNDEATYNETRGMNGMKLNDYVDELLESSSIDGFFADLINAALSRVHWNEISESMAEA
jgi:hypothetical protein